MIEITDNKNMIKKTLQPTNELLIQFSNEEVQELGLEQGQRYEVKLQDDGSIELRPFVKLELDIDEWPREVLEMIVKESCEKDISANDVINDILKRGLADYGDDEVCCGSGCDSHKDALKSVHGCSGNDAVLPTAWNDNVTTASSHYASLSTRCSTDSINFNVPSIDPDTINADTSILSDSYKFSVESDMLFNPEQK